MTIIKNANKAKRWTHAVLGDLLDVLDAGVADEGRHCTRSKFVREAIVEKRERQAFKPEARGFRL